MKRRAIVLSKVLIAVPLLATSAGGAWFLWPMSLVTPAPADVEASLRLAGINPQALAAAGVNAAQTTGLFADASSYLTDALAGLQSADAAVASSRHDVERLERAVVAGVSTPEQRTALAAARSTLASAISDRAAALDGLTAAATADLTPERIAALASIRTNAASWDQPVQYLVVDRNEAARVEFREALAAVRIAGEQGVDPDQTAVGIVNSWNGDPGVAAATTSLNSNLASVTAAWAAGLAP